LEIDPNGACRQSEHGQTDHEKSQVIPNDDGKNPGLDDLQHKRGETDEKYTGVKLSSVHENLLIEKIIVLCRQLGQNNAPALSSPWASGKGVCHTPRPGFPLLLTRKLFLWLQRFAALAGGNLPANEMRGK
jgi:hypothetical protein